jgi:hypothetical protein
MIEDRAARYRIHHDPAHHLGVAFLHFFDFFRHSAGQADSQINGARFPHTARFATHRLLDFLSANAGCGKT